MDTTEKMTTCLAAKNDFITDYTQTWKLMLPNTPPPSARQIFVWLELHTPERLCKALRKTSIKAEVVENSGQEFGTEFAICWLSSVANRLKTDEEGERR